MGLPCKGIGLGYLSRILGTQILPVLWELLILCRLPRMVRRPLRRMRLVHSMLLLSPACSLSPGMHLMHSMLLLCPSTALSPCRVVPRYTCLSPLTRLLSCPCTCRISWRRIRRHWRATRGRLPQSLLQGVIGPVEFAALRIPLRFPNALLLRVPHHRGQGRIASCACGCTRSLLFSGGRTRLLCLPGGGGGRCLRPASLLRLLRIVGCPLRLQRGVLLRPTCVLAPCLVLSRLLSPLLSPRAVLRLL